MAPIGKKRARPSDSTDTEREDPNPQMEKATKKRQSKNTKRPK